MPVDGRLRDVEALKESGKIPEARERVKFVLKQWPEFDQGWAYAAQLAADAGEREAHLRRVIEVTSDAGLLAWALEELTNLQNPEAAVKVSTPPAPPPRYRAIFQGRATMILVPLVSISVLILGRLLLKSTTTWIDEATRIVEQGGRLSYPPQLLLVPLGLSGIMILFGAAGIVATFILPFIPPKPK
jgi:hypothetical protein